MDRVHREALHRDMARLADGDRDAFHPVFVRLWPLLRGFVGRHLSPEDTEDAAQEALLKVFARAAEFDTRRDALSWVLGIAAYEVKTTRRKTWRRKEAPGETGELLAGMAGPQAGPEEMALMREREEELAEALKGLDEADAATLHSYAHDERPDVPGPTFRKRVQRALARLRAAWGTSHGRP